MISGTTQAEGKAAALAARATPVPRVDTLSRADIGNGCPCVQDSKEDLDAGKIGSKGRHPLETPITSESCQQDWAQHQEGYGRCTGSRSLAANQKQANTRQRQQKQRSVGKSLKEAASHDTQRKNMQSLHCPKQEAQNDRQWSGMLASLLEVGTYDDEHSKFVPRAGDRSHLGQRATQSVMVLLHQPLRRQLDRDTGVSDTEEEIQGETPQGRLDLECRGEEHETVTVVVRGPTRRACEELKSR